MSVSQRNNPSPRYRFRVEIEGVTRAGFQECSGLDTSQDPIDYRNGVADLTAHQLPDQHPSSTILLRHGITDDAALWEWRNQASTGTIERRSGAIVLLDEAGREQRRWNFRRGWPAKLTSPTLNATGNEMAIETLEIVHEGVAKA